MQGDVYRGDGLSFYIYCRNNLIGYYDSSGYAKEKRKITLENKPIILEDRTIGSFSYRTGECLDIVIDEEYLEEVPVVDDPQLKKDMQIKGRKEGRKAVENTVAKGAQDCYIQIGDAYNEKFPVIDLTNAEMVVSVKSMNVHADSYVFYDAIDGIKITVNDKEVKKGYW